MKRLLAILSLIVATTAWAQTPSAFPYAKSIPNDTTTGTTQFTLTQINSSGNAVITSTSTTNGYSGVCVVNCGSAGTAWIAFAGLTPLKMDGTATAQHYVKYSTTSAGFGSDTGSSSYPSSGAVLGRIQSGCSGSGCTAIVDLYASEVQASVGAVNSITGDGALITNSASTGPVTLTLGNAAGHKYWGNNTASSATAAFDFLGDNDMSPNWYAAGGGTAQAQTVTLSPAATTLTAGLQVNWLPTAANTSSGPTLAVNGLTATTITKCGTTALAASDLTTSAVAQAIYDGTRFQLLNPQATGCAGASTPGSSSEVIYNSSGALAGDPSFEFVADTSLTLQQTTAAGGSNDNSPTFNIGGTVFNGTSSVNDVWTATDVIGTGSNGTSSLTFTHTGSTGATYITIPNAQTSLAPLQFAGSNGTGIGTVGNTGVLAFYGASGATAGAQIQLKTNNGTTTAYIQSPNSGTSPVTPMILNTSNTTNAALDLIGNVTTATNQVAEVFIGNNANYGGTATEMATLLVGQSTLGWNAASGSGNFDALEVNSKINQTGSASGSYTGLKVAITETALLGTANKLLDLFAGSGGTTEMFGITNKGNIITAGTNSVASTVSVASSTTASVSFTNSYVSTPVCVLTPQTTGLTSWYLSAISNTGFTVTVAPSGSYTFGYLCQGNPN